MGKIITYYYIRRYKVVNYDWNIQSYTGEEYIFPRIKDAAEWLIKNKISKNSIAGLSSRISTIKNTPSIGYGFKWNTIQDGDYHS